jgi:DHA2 family multidrug resistance protein-like MFS transporter
VALEDGTPEAVKAGRREWIGLAVLTLACVLYAMDLTVLHLAVPSLSADLEPTSAQLLWIVDIYGFMVAGCLITMGTLGDRIGRRRLLMIGAAAFALVSVLAAFSNSAELLIVCRALQGIAGATLAPSTLSLIFSMFRDPHERSVAIGVWIAGFSAGGAVGPVLGGVLLEQFWWGSVFLLAVPVMALLLVLGPRLLPEFRDPNAGTLDVASAALSLFSILALIFGLKEIAQDGIGWLPVSTMVVGLAVGIVFARRQRSLTDPMIDLRLFQIRAFNASLATNVLGIFIMVGYFLFVAQYLQLVLGLSPLEAGLWSLPDAAALIVGSTFAPRLLRRIRPAIVIGAGLLLGAVGLVMLARVGPSDLALVVAASVVIALGLAPVFTATTDLIVGSAPPERAGAASGISETGSELGGALGIAILGSVGTAIYRAKLAGELPSELPPETVAAARDTLGAAVAITDQLPAGLGDVVIATARNAFIHGMRVTSGIAVVVAIAVAAVAVMYLRHVPSGDGREKARESDGAESERDATVRPVSDVMTP